MALNQVIVTPDNVFGFDWTVAMLVMTIVGGIGTVVGPLAGAFVVYYLIQQQLLNYPALSGVLLIAVVRFTRNGVWGALCSLPGGQSDCGGMTRSPYDRKRHRCQNRQQRSTS